jgi:hypothetical protein
MGTISIEILWEKNIQEPRQCMLLEIGIGPVVVRLTRRDLCLIVKITSSVLKNILKYSLPVNVKITL